MMHNRAFANENERLTQLLLDRALQGLADDEATELESLLGDDVADSTLELTFDPAGFEEVAAASALAMIGRVDVMPLALRERLSAQGRTWRTEQAAPARPAMRIDNARADAAATLARGSQARSSSFAWTGWLAAAACLALALLAWWPRLVPPRLPSATDQRAQLIADKPTDLIRWTWTPTHDPSAAGLTGDVVWSDSAQKGYLRFKNLAKNDPRREQYQLWIFDARRKADYPVDGGVFDITADGEVVIPIDPKLHVFNASMFAVTVEKPGGVARSDRERIPTLAKPAAP